nr:ATP synthase F0 subunit 8 [Sobrala sp. SL-2021a]
MPQMSPLWWTFMMIMFLMTFNLMMNMIYFNYKMKIESKFNITKKNIYWMW